MYCLVSAAARSWLTTSAGYASEMLQSGLERLTKRPRSRQAGAACARNRHVPPVHSGSERAVRAHLTAARYVLLAALIREQVPSARRTASPIDRMIEALLMTLRPSPTLFRIPIQLNPASPAP
ncbi:hypothetical protein XAC3810_170020 [Xanthomonas citri pv. citri]|uniref:Transposase n=1 Tax=Xanthomonas citri pv. citri TaxID=611301 RepID=A0A0U4YHJ1_XANCI|nr:hypothetical protein XAC3824_140129 [Xanthomonas citri pv. citri]CEE18467.1 hypothetical protein XAC9322_140272 [Xanthomonas citri pv. citri]CEE19484.1 hypothetical protein XAC1083_150133 [Xanthomonas citri pv. citri]CEE26844.1 hypothetical protein XAC902_160173 [Xanthomonas citri pv. citri]CEE27014.1 hypothetical protein XAC2911_130126 [Xanthomonas citri pv. citri]